MNDEKVCHFNRVWLIFFYPNPKFRVTNAPQLFLSLSITIFSLLMKKLYHKGTVHPSPPLISDQFSFLSAAILTLVEALSPEDREVLSYLISHSSSTFSGKENRCRNRPFPFVQLQLLLLLHGLLDQGDESLLCFSVYCFWYMIRVIKGNFLLLHMP